VPPWTRSTKASVQPASASTALQRDDDLVPVPLPVRCADPITDPGRRITHRHAGF